MLSISIELSIAKLGTEEKNYYAIIRGENLGNMDKKGRKYGDTIGSRIRQ